MTNQTPLVPADAQPLPHPMQPLGLRFRGNERGTIASPRLVATICLSLALAYLVVLGGGVLTGQWLIDGEGRPVASDFVNVWAAGRLAADGHPALAYDWAVHKSMEVRAVGHAFDNYYGWHYPPPFLFVAMALSFVPFLPASLLWLAVTLPIYLAAIRAIIGERVGYLIALAFPAALWNVIAGQNGFLTAGLIGGTLTLLERRPILAGICLGLVSYKPHFGLLFPVALIAGRHWRTLGAATITALAMIALSWFAFGTTTWVTFVQATPKMTQAVMGDGLADFTRLQSLFGLVRAQGGSEALAWLAQIVAALGCAVAIFLLWRSRAPYPLKAAMLAACALIATPYLYIYDLVVLAIPFAYLLRACLARGFTRIEATALSAVVVLLLSYPYLKTQVGLAAVLLVAAMIGVLLRGADASEPASRAA